MSEAQEAALAALRGGQTFVLAAAEAGVSRMTVYRWVRGDPHFRAAYNAWQQEAAESARARLIELADRAVDVVARALKRGDEKVALKVLRGVGALRKRPRESTRPEVLDLQFQLRDKRELRHAELGLVQYLLKKSGMGARERKRVLTGGPDTSEFMDDLRRELERRESKNGKQDEKCVSPGSPAAPHGEADPEPGGHDRLSESAAREDADVERSDAAGDVTPPDAAAGPAGAAAEPSACDNPCEASGMRIPMSEREPAADPVTPEGTSGEMSHGPVGAAEPQVAEAGEVTGELNGIPCYKRYVG